MNHPARAVAFLLLAPLFGIVSGCGAFGVHFRSPITVGAAKHAEPTLLAPAAIQSEVMSFTDTFNSAVSQQWNQAGAEGRADSAPGGLASPTAGDDRPSRVRRAALENKLAVVSAALAIASSPNPRVALCDMITMITLQRMVLESPDSVALYGKDMSESLVATFREQETKVWRIAARAITPEHQEELKKLISDWRAQHPTATYVSNVRLEDFAAAREQTFLPGTQSSGSLLSLLALDPLAELDPAEREVQKSRLLGERMFFYATRTPQILKWQTESLYQDLFRTPEFKDALASAQKATESAARISTVAEQFSTELAAGRSAAVDELFKKLASERQSAVEQINQDVSAQREALLKDLDQAQGKFQGTLKDFRETAETTDKLAASLKEAIKAADTLVARFGPAPGAAPTPKGPDRDVLAEYRAAMVQTGDTVDRLTTLTHDLDTLLASPVINGKSTIIHDTVLDAQSSSQQLIDYAFKRLLILALVTPLAIALAAWAYRLATRKLTAASR